MSDHHHPHHHSDGTQFTESEQMDIEQRIKRHHELNQKYVIENDEKEGCIRMTKWPIIQSSDLTNSDNFIIRNRGDVPTDSNDRHTIGHQQEQQEQQEQEQQQLQTLNKIPKRDIKIMSTLPIHGKKYTSNNNNGDNKHVSE